MVDRLPGGGDVGKVFQQIGEKAKPAKEAVANFFRARAGDLAPVPQKIQQVKERAVSTFDSFRATINLDNRSFKEFKKNAAAFTSIASSALTSVKAELAGMKDSEAQLKAQENMTKNNPLFLKGGNANNAKFIFEGILKADVPPNEHHTSPELLRFLATKDPNKFEVHCVERKEGKMELVKREIQINKDGEYIMDGEKFKNLERIKIYLGFDMPTYDDIRSAKATTNQINPHSGEVTDQRG